LTHPETSPKNRRKLKQQKEISMAKHTEMITTSRLTERTWKNTFVFISRCKCRCS